MKQDTVRRIRVESNRGSGASRPQHLCNACMSVRHATDTRCEDCGRTIPTDGWAPLATIYDPFLGRILDNRYTVNRILGQGHSGVVYRAKALTTSRDLAIKIVTMPVETSSRTSYTSRQLEKEIEALSRLRSPHIVRSLEVLKLIPNRSGIHPRCQHRLPPDVI